jgi:hypothetical protein
MKTLQEKIAVMQAFADGKTIEIKTIAGSRWLTVGNNRAEPGWNWDDFDYRIKHEPVVVERMFYVNRETNDTLWISGLLPLQQQPMGRFLVRVEDDKLVSVEIVK